MPIDSTADLVDLLGRLQLLSASDLEGLRPQLSRYAGPRELASDLINRGALTPFQVNLILLDRGEELVLGSYVLLERLGEGGMGTVYKARHVAMRRLVA